MSDGVLGLDTSHYAAPGRQNAVPTQADMDCAWSQGYRFWIVGCQVPSVYIPTIRTLAHDGRFRIECYEYLYQSTGPESQIRADLQRLEDAGVLQHVKRFWIDYETGAELPGDAEVLQIKHLIRVIESKGPAGGWYSGNWWTSGNISPAGIAELAGIPYWIAYYIGGPNPIYGQPVHTKQYKGSTLVCGGINADLNWRPQAVWDAEEDDDIMTPEQFIDMLESMNADQLNRAYKAGYKRTVLDVYPAPPEGIDAKDFTADAWLHNVKGRLEALEKGGTADNDHTHPIPDHEHGGVKQ